MIKYTQIYKTAIKYANGHNVTIQFFDPAKDYNVTCQLWVYGNAREIPAAVKKWLAVYNQE